MVGLGTVRGAVVGNEDRPATPEEISRMVGLVRRALEEGVCGASSGLEYTPGAFARREELIALCRPLAERGLPYATHLRNEDDRLLEAIEEAIAVAPRIRTEALAKVELIGGWDSVMIASVRNEADKPAEGQRLGAYSAAAGSDPYQVAGDGFPELLGSGLDVGDEDLLGLPVLA
jgi:hypothetical protein